MEDGQTDRQTDEQTGWGWMAGLVLGADHFPDRGHEPEGWQRGWGWEEASYLQVLTETTDCDQVSAPPIRKTVLSLKQRDIT